MKRLENIAEECLESSETEEGVPPETPTESMVFLARSWSLSSMELSKALSCTHISCHDLDHCSGDAKACFSDLASNESSIVRSSPRDSEDTQELFLLHQALSQDFLNDQQLLKNVYKGILKGKTVGRWLKDHKESKKQENRTHAAQLHAAVSAAGVAAAVAALTASNVMSQETSTSRQKAASKTTAAVASAAALVASHCIETAENMGADCNHILTVVNSAINARTNGDIMTLTAGAATALRGAATLRARLQKGHGVAAFPLAEEQLVENKELNIPIALKFVLRGGELLKRTRKGALHWKEVSFNMSSDFQVVAKMKRKHMAGTFTKKKTCIVSGVCSDIPAWPGRGKESNDQKAYFGIKAADRIIEFECKNKDDKQLWVEGLQNLLHGYTF